MATKVSYRAEDHSSRWPSNTETMLSCCLIPASPVVVQKGDVQEQVNVGI